jgi:hypothetical protein
MDALDEVKQEIQKRNVTKRRQAEMEYNRQMRQAIFSKNKPIPPVKSFRSQTTQNACIIEAEEVKEISDDKVDIKYLKWEDKEKILRVLFAKMNGLVVVQSNDHIRPEEEPALKEIRSYRGGEYPIGPSAFSGSLSDRVDRISTIDHDNVDNYQYENDAIPQNTTEMPIDNHEIPDKEVQIIVSDPPLMPLPIITMEEDETALPIFVVEQL